MVQHVYNLIDEYCTLLKWYIIHHAFFFKLSGRTVCKIMHKAAELMHHYWRMNDKTARGFDGQDDA